MESIPPDLAVVAGYVVVFDVAVASPLVRESPLQPLLALPILLFLPGYVLVAALFPTNGEGSERTGSADTDSRSAVASRVPRRIDFVERVALSFGLSVALLPWLGVLLPAMLRFGSNAFFASFSVLVLAGVAIGTVRRLHYPEDERFGVPYRRWIAKLRSTVFQSSSPVDAAVNAALILSVIAALCVLAYAFAVPNYQASYSDFYLVTENETGAAVAAGYPTDFTRGEGKQLTIGVKNREGRQVVYAIVIELQRVQLHDDSVQVIEERELARLRADISADSTWTSRQTIVPGLAGEDLRLQFYLYRGDPPSDPSPETAYRHLYLWIDVSRPSDSASENRSIVAGT